MEKQRTKKKKKKYVSKSRMVSTDDKDEARIE